MQVGLFIGILNQTSQMTFGGYDDNYIKKGSDTDGYGFHWYPLIGKNWW